MLEAIWGKLQIFVRGSTIHPGTDIEKGHRKKMDIIIVGGSICGLMHGVALKGLGHNIRILEAREPHLLEAEAAGLSIGPQAQELLQSIGLEVESYAIHGNKLQILDQSGNVTREMTPAFHLATSNWNTVFNLLKEEFLNEKNGNENVSFEAGKIVTDVSYDGLKVNVTYQGTNDKALYTLSAELVIAADGSQSTIRKKVLPKVTPEFAGYVAWRGSILENLAPHKLRRVFEEKMAMILAKNSYILLCPTPGEDGNTAPGHRLLDWVWYEYCEQSSSALEANMPGSMGRHHKGTVPRGHLDNKIWRQAVKRAQDMFPSIFAEVVWKTGAPFLTAITNFQSDQASFFDGRLLLCGNAFTQLRPHLGLGCDLAATQALSLVKVLKRDMKLDQWEKEAVAHAQEYSYRSVAMGQFGMTGRFPEGYVP